MNSRTPIWGHSAFTSQATTITSQVKLFLLLVSSQLARTALHVVILTIFIDERYSAITSSELFGFLLLKMKAFRGAIQLAKVVNLGRAMAYKEQTFAR